MKRRLNEKPKQQHDDISLEESIFSAIVGKDMHGQVRMVRFRVTPKELHETEAMRIERLIMENEELHGKISALKNELAELKQTTEERFARLESQMASQMSMLTQLMQERRSQ